MHGKKIVQSLNPSNTTSLAEKILGDESIFWRPNFLARSGWLEHIPFAFWIVKALKPSTIVELGCHHGVSYFAFCQAVERLSLNTKCFAVDTWKGDAHAGFYDETVYQNANLYNNTHYRQFSRLIRSTFEDASQYFLDGTIDLLHVDGFHTYESVRKDVNMWLPKMSEKGVLLIHDTNVRERGFGVYKLLAELGESHPHFEFSHGHGLGVLAIGRMQTKDVEKLFKTKELKNSYHQVQNAFGRLGEACANSFYLTLAPQTPPHPSSTSGQGKMSSIESESGIISKENKPDTAEIKKNNEKLVSAEAVNSNKKFESLKKELDIAKASLTRLSQLENDYLNVLKKNSTLERCLKKRFDEVATLTNLHEKKAATLIETQTKLEKIKAEKKSADKKIEELESNVAQNDILSRDLKATESSLKRRFLEIATLTKATIALEQEQLHIRTFNAALKTRLRHAQENISRAIEKILRNPYTTPPDFLICAFSEYFDSNWYIETYPDAISSNLDPVSHFIYLSLHKNHRDPGPNFSSTLYLDTYPEVKSIGMLPIVHYIKFGREEGRIAHPSTHGRQIEQH